MTSAALRSQMRPPNLVTILDNSGNEIVSFGKYGNFDSQYINLNTKEGKETSRRSPRRTFRWAGPTARVSAKSTSMSWMYITTNRASDKTYAAEAVVELK